MAESMACMIALALSLFVQSSPFRTRDVQGSTGSSASAFRTDRLTAPQVRLWMSLRKIALVSDSRGLPLHPILHELWRTVEESGHVVVVELVTDKKRSSNVAGECSVEGLDPTGRSHTFKLTLFIATINRAYAQEQAPREGMEFVPFSGLTRQGRYAKVLGHELAHIAQSVRDPAYLRLLREICVEQRAIAVEVRRGGTLPSLSALQQRSDRIWPRVLESERPALAAEREIRRELLAGK